MKAEHPSHVTLLATTRGRFKQLQRLLDSLCCQTNNNFTLLLGDQNPKPYLESLLSKYSSRINIQRVQLAKVSLSKARNLLLPYVKGDIIALTDDDCYYASDCLDHVTQIFSSNREIAALIGNANAHSQKDVSERSETKFSVFKGAPSWVIFIRTNTALAVGQFDEKIGTGSDGPYQSGEETDYLLRIIFSQTGSVLRSKRVKVFHDDFLLGLDTFSQKAYFYGLGRMYLLYKHRFPLWFKLANIVYPLCKAFVEGGGTWVYRWAMFRGRLQGLLKLSVMKILSK